MKATIFALLFVIVQACYAQDLTQEMIQSLDKCVESLNLNRDDLIELNKQVEIPEDNEDTIKFLECYTKDIGIVDAQGNLVTSKILETIEAKLKLQMKNIPDGDAKAHHIASSAIEHCKDSSKEGSVGLVALRNRNCIRAFIARPQLLNQ